MAWEGLNKISMQRISDLQGHWSHGSQHRVFPSAMLDGWFSHVGTIGTSYIGCHVPGTDSRLLFAIKNFTNHHRNVKIFHPQEKPAIWYYRGSGLNWLSLRVCFMLNARTLSQPPGTSKQTTKATP